MDKKLELGRLASKMQTAKLPLKTNLVFGEGSPEAQVLFIGEAPGAKEDLLGRPFVGRSGELLTKTIEEIGWKREDVYITNIVKRRPPENRDPSPEEIEAYTPYLAKQIEIINPKIIVTLGRFATNYFLPELKISKDQGSVFKYEGRTIIPQFHPAAALRGTTVKNKFRKSFAKLPRLIKKIS
ncbi:MAG: uracil-DNA glycosylase [bacterium]|nr:uracil-DNA glycosylase [bacterium]